MSDHLPPIHAIKAVINEAEHPSPEAARHLTDELNALSKMQLESLCNLGPVINKALVQTEHDGHLPHIEFDHGGFGHGGKNWESTDEFGISFGGQQVYKRQFTENSAGQKADHKFAPITLEERSVQIITPGASGQGSDR